MAEVNGCATIRRQIRVSVDCWSYSSRIAHILYRDACPVLPAVALVMYGASSHRELSRHIELNLCCSAAVAYRWQQWRQQRGIYHRR